MTVYCEKMLVQWRIAGLIAASIVKISVSVSSFSDNFNTMVLLTPDLAASVQNSNSSEIFLEVWAILC